MMNTPLRLAAIPASIVSILHVSLLRDAAMPTRKLNIAQAKAQFSRLINDAAHGKTTNVARGGRPVARIAPLDEKPRKINHLLLDSHLLLWLIEPGTRHLPSRAKRIIAGAASVHYSIVSLWEIAVKAAKGDIGIDLDVLIESPDQADSRVAR
jgi:antitoxin (DNA-binding transcriptional repressor) of toxin-antitoxin stability system